MNIEGWKLFVTMNDGSKGSAQGVYCRGDYTVLWMSAERMRNNGEIKDFEIKWVKVKDNKIVEIMDEAC